MVSPFIAPIPEALLKDPDTAEFFRNLLLVLDDLLRPEGAIATSEATTEVVLTQQEKLDLMTVTQDVNLDTVESQTVANTTSLASLLDSLPAYSISNDGTDRTFNADAAAGAITNPPTQAEVENIRDAVLEQADVLATVIRDMVNKNVFGT